MAAGRPDIPAEMRRDVLVEAGHRCAIPTCKVGTTEIAHIVPWSTVQKHTFDNLIALCPNCHTRFDKGEIDRKAMLQYKANLGVISGRYGDIERRLLRLFAESPAARGITLPGGLDVLLMYLLEDGLIVRAASQSNLYIMGVPSVQNYEITQSGRDFIARWLAADPLP